MFIVLYGVVWFWIFLRCLFGSYWKADFNQWFRPTWGLCFCSQIHLLRFSDVNHIIVSDVLSQFEKFIWNQRK